MRAFEFDLDGGFKFDALLKIGSSWAAYDRCTSVSVSDFNLGVDSIVRNEGNRLGAYLLTERCDFQVQPVTKSICKNFRRESADSELLDL